MTMTKATKNKITTFYWNVFNGAVAIILVYLTEIDYQYVILIQPLFSLITKELNKHFNPNYGE